MIRPKIHPTPRLNVEHPHSGRARSRPDNPIPELERDTWASVTDPDRDRVTARDLKRLKEKFR